MKRLKTKKLLLLSAVISAISLLFFTACQPSGNDNSGNGNSDNPPPVENPEDNNDDDSNNNNNNDDTTDADVICINAGEAVAAENHSWLITGISMYEFNSKTVDVDFSAKMKVVNTGDAVKLSWSINLEGYPEVASATFENGTSDWVTVSGSKSDLAFGDWPQLYIGTYQVTASNLTIYLKDINLKVTDKADAANTKTYTTVSDTAGVTTVKESTVPAAGNNAPAGGNDEDPEYNPPADANWLSDSVPSLKETFKDDFDSIGIAAEYGNFGIKAVTSDKYGDYTADGYWGTPNELYYEEIQKGIAKHANSITLGNELKPQFLLQWWSGSIGSDAVLVDFTASNGEKIKVPSKLNGENLIYATLSVCKKMGIQMRGHVLTWHSQTPDGFFAEDYTPVYNGDLITNLVTPEVMTARHEWYIKTVLKCVDDWEKANNYRAIWAWDVVNEAMADDAGKTYTGDNQNWLRGSTAGTKDKSPDNGGGSRWYQVYGNEEFIVNAFRFANAYAPNDVKLCYNDYNEYWDAEGHYKTSAIEHIVSCIKNGEAQTINGKSVAPRFDVIAMQSHVGPSWPGAAGYESALKRFLALADVHVSEIDFSAETQAIGTQTWAEYFTMLQKYGKKYSGTHKVRNVTIWGINNESSWINPSIINRKKVKTYPLLFNLVNNVDGNKKDVEYDTGAESLPQYDVGDTYKPNEAFWAVINTVK